MRTGLTFIGVGIALILWGFLSRRGDRGTVFEHEWQRPLAAGVVFLVTGALVVTMHAQLPTLK